MNNKSSFHARALRIATVATLLAFSLPAWSQTSAPTEVPPPVVAPTPAPPPLPVTSPADSIARAAPARATWSGQQDPRAGQATVAPLSLLRGGPLGELVAIYSPRNVTEIERQIEDAQSQQRLAQSEIDESRRVADAADGQVRIMNEELRTTKTRRNVAKQMKNETDHTTLSADSKRQDTEKSYLERLRDALRADADRLESDRDAAAARAKALHIEADVARKHAQITATAATPSPTDVASYRDLLKQMLNAQKTAADRGTDAASKRREVADKRLKQLEALSKIGR